MTPSKPTDGSGNPSPRFACQRCKPSHSIGMEDVFDAIGEKLKEVKITEQEHEMLVIAEWEDYKIEREQSEAEKRRIVALKASNKSDTDETKERLNTMKYSKPKAKPDEIAVEERRLIRLDDERKSLLKREEKVGDESMERYYALDAFLELARNGSQWWKKASDEQKRKLADLIVSNVVIDDNKVASVSLAEPFAGWAKRGKDLDGRLWAAQLERLREYHREHGSLGKRYIEVIRAFNPNYAPHTEDELATLSRSLPILAIT
jgi:hypothetical protein